MATARRSPTAAWIAAHQARRAGSVPEPHRSDTGLRLLAVHAHPDDESSKGAASTARYVREGVAVTVATCTGGERGSVLNPALDTPEVRADLPERRHAEMAAAREILGVDQVWLGWADSGMPDTGALPADCFAAMPVDEAAAPLVALIRRFRPQVLTTYPEGGDYPHPDHAMAHRISAFAYEAAADPHWRPDLGEPWSIDKLYFHRPFHADRLQAWHDELLARGLASPYADRLAAGACGDGLLYPGADLVTTRVECADEFATADAALRAHATQIDPDGEWFSTPLEVRRAAWPTEDFQLAASRVPVELPEVDLFAGLRAAPVRDSPARQHTAVRPTAAPDPRTGLAPASESVRRPATGAPAADTAADTGAGRWARRPSLSSGEEHTRS